jgi:MFS superfamily sulfate permease-like transporter
VTAAIGVLAIGVLPGMLIAVIVSLVLLLRVLSRPTILELGRVGDSRVYLPLDSEGVAPVPGLSILRPEGPLFFANLDRVRDRVRQELVEGHPPRRVLLNLGATPLLGIASHDLLAQLHAELETLGVELSLARVSPEVEAFLRRSGLLDKIGRNRVFTSQGDAVEAYLASSGPLPSA